MRKLVSVIAATSLGLFLAVPHGSSAATLPTNANWQAKVNQDLPLLGHRNWILIVDSAYPLQSAPGVETIETNADHIDVLRYVLSAIRASIHVRPDIFMDAELPFVPDQDAPGASAYRERIGKILGGVNVTQKPHEQLIKDIDASSRLVHVLVLKTRLAVPYSSVFIRLNCKYWSDAAEERLRARMAATGTTGSVP